MNKTYYLRLQTAGKAKTTCPILMKFTHINKEGIKKLYTIDLK